MIKEYSNRFRLAGIVLILTCPAFNAWGQSSQDSRQQVISRMEPYSGDHHDGVDSSTLKGKVICGYQGWFAAPDDGSGRGWVHYAEHHNILEPGHCSFDLWPDMSEMDNDEKYATPFKHRDGSTAYLFSPYNPKTVLRHFRWMKDYQIDGVFLQRFGTSLKAPPSLNHCNVVLANVQAGANQHGRTWAVMYDLSGLQAGEIDKFVIEDWKLLFDNMKITHDQAYLHHNGKPVVAVWGIGFNDGRNYSLDECEKLIQFLKHDKKYGANTVMLGVPTYWRTMSRDAVKDPKLHEIISQADIVSPWTVGRYNSPDAAKNYADNCMKDDLEWTRNQNLDYLPVVFPGFSWQNLMETRGKQTPLDEIPRLKGQFLWSQIVASRKAGAEMLYLAMFDEVDEGTAVFKCTNNPPVGISQFLTYENLPTDHYLWLAGQAAQLLRDNHIPASDQIPPRKAQPNPTAEPNAVPPIPPGFPDEQSIKFAILLGQIKLVNAINLTTPDNVEEILDLEYGSGGQHKLQLDLYLPKDRTQPTPAIIFIHGGAWKAGNRRDMKYYCLKFAEKGYVTATVTYRLIGQAPFPAPIQDVKCAVRWLRAHAEKYQIDPDRIVASGNSAGGHLSMMIGYSDDPSLEGTGGHNNQSSRVAAVVNFYGPTDLTTEFAKKQGDLKDFMAGKTFDEAPDSYKLASPLFHLTEDDPPTLIFHGTIDSIVPIVQADLLADKLKELKIDYLYEKYPGWPHAMDLAESVNRRCIYQMEQFFKKHNISPDTTIRKNQK